MQEDYIYLYQNKSIHLRACLETSIWNIRKSQTKHIFVTERPIYPCPYAVLWTA